MRLNKIKLQNFRGLPEVVFDLSGQSATIAGQNASGKTTLANAYSYLLTDKAYTGEAGFTPKTIGERGEVHGLNHIVEAEFSSPDGATVTLRKDYHEVWTKKRGSTDAVLSGNTVDYYVDDVPVKAKDYQEQVAALFGDQQIISMLSNPTYFAEALPWKERREILLQICGDVDEQEILNGMPELKQALSKGASGARYTLDELAAKAAAAKKAANKLLEELPARVDEANKAMPDLAGVKSKEEIGKKIDELQKQVAVLEAFSSNPDTAAQQQINEIAKNINILDSEILAAERRFIQDQKDKNADVNKEISAIESELYYLEGDQRKKRELLETIKSDINAINDGRERVQFQYRSVQEEVFKGDTVCPTCGQDLPEEKVATALKDWNQSKAKRLEAILTEGKQKFGKELLQQKIDEQQQIEEELTSIIQSISTKKTALENAQLRLSTDRWEDSEDFNSMSGVREALNRELLNAKQAEVIGQSGAEKERSDEIKAIKAYINDLEEMQLKIKQADVQKQRIKELEGTEKVAAKEFERVEFIIAQCEAFTKRRADLLTANINNKFNTVSFSLFAEQVNGGIKDQCEVLIPAAGGEMIPWASANHAAKINAGLELIEALSKHYGRSIPIFIDGAESVTDYIEIDAQIIKLQVAAEAERLELKKGA